MGRVVNPSHFAGCHPRAKFFETASEISQKYSYKLCHEALMAWLLKFMQPLQCLDNLIKGAAVVAVQNLNLMLGCGEETALL